MLQLQIKESCSLDIFGLFLICVANIFANIFTEFLKYFDLFKEALTRSIQFYVLCTVVRCTLYYCTVYSVLLYGVRCTVYGCNVRCTALFCTLYYLRLYCTLYCLTVYAVLVQVVLYAVIFELHKRRFMLKYILYCQLVHSTLYFFSR